MDYQHLIDISFKDEPAYEARLNQLATEEIDALAMLVAKQFLNETLSWHQGSRLLNRTMPIYGFERAPSLFWDVYLAFEDAETSDNPVAITKAALSKILNS